MMPVVALQLSHRNAMPHMQEVSDEEYGTYNPSFRFTDRPGMCSHQDIPPCGRPVPLRTTTAPDTSVLPTETVHSPVIPNDNDSTPTKSPPSSHTSHPAAVDVSPTQIAQDSAPRKENPGSPTDTSPDPSEAPPNTSPHPITHDTTNTPLSTCPDSQTTETTSNDDSAVNVTSPSSQSSIPCSHTRIASAEIDKPLCKPCMKTPPYSPLQPSPLTKGMDTPPPAPDNVPLKTMLVHIDTSPVDTPLATPERTSMALSAKVAQLSTSLEETDQSEHPDGAADAGSPFQDRRPSTNSGNTQDGREVGDADDNGFLGDEDADKNSEGEDELEPEEEELLRVLARCNPIFLTFSK